MADFDLGAILNSLTPDDIENLKQTAASVLGGGNMEPPKQENQSKQKQEQNQFNFDDLLNDGSYKVVLHKNVNYDVRREDLSNIKTSVTLNEDDYFPLTKEFKISFKETYDYINPQDARFRDILDNVVNGIIKLIAIIPSLTVLL